MQKIEELASVHLGKAGDGTVVKPYVTPETVDPSLLVGIPRSLNRENYGLVNQLPFVGVDIWHAYETSYLHKNGFPSTGVTKIVYSAFSKNIVESKSLKLYLNSYNLDSSGDLNDHNIATRIGSDLAPVVGVLGFVATKYFPEDEQTNLAAAACHPITAYNLYWPLEYLCDNTVNFKFDRENPHLLRIKPATKPGYYSSSSLRSNCRVTNQPDWGTVYIAMEGKYTVEPLSLLQYIVSFRKENHFHEEVCEMIYKRLWDMCKPEKLFVACLYTRRGGIDINPVRASSLEYMRECAPTLIDANTLTRKTLKQ